MSKKTSNRNFPADLAALFKFDLVLPIIAIGASCLLSLFGFLKTENAIILFYAALGAGSLGILCTIATLSTTPLLDFRSARTSKLQSETLLAGVFVRRCRRFVVSDYLVEGKIEVSVCRVRNLERAKGFEPSTLTLAT
jgi:hypothetical protein